MRRGLVTDVVEDAELPDRATEPSRAGNGRPGHGWPCGC